MGFDPDPRHLNAGFLLIRYGGTRHRPTARTADRAVPVELGRFLAVNHVVVPVFWTRGRPKHQAALRLSFSRTRAGVRYPCRWRSHPRL